MEFGSIFDESLPILSFRIRNVHFVGSGNLLNLMPLMQYLNPSISSVKFSISQLSLQIGYLISLNLFGYSIRLCIFRSRFLGTQPFAAPIILVDCIQSKSLAKFQRNTSTKSNELNFMKVDYVFEMEFSQIELWI